MVVLIHVFKSFHAPCLNLQSSVGLIMSTCNVALMFPRVQTPQYAGVCDETSNLVSNPATGSILSMVHFGIDNCAKY